MMNFSPSPLVKARLRSAREGVARVLASPFAGMQALLPRRVRVHARELSRIKGSLDYPDDALRIYIDSPTEIWRTASCAKEPGTLQWLNEFVGPEDVFYDIGANVGAYTLIAASKVGSHGTVVSFEPSFRNFARLNENIELNGFSERVITIPLALSNDVGLARFLFSSTETGAASHSMDGMSQRKETGKLVAVSHVLMARLDDVVARYNLPLPTVLKLDVDGPELEVLEGCGAILESPTLRSILVEMEPNEETRQRICDYLKKKGWAVGTRNRHFGNTVDEDWVWVRAADR